MKFIHDIKVGDIVSARFDDYVIVKRGEVLHIPVWHNDLWIIRDLAQGENFQLSNTRTELLKIL